MFDSSTFAFILISLFMVLLCASVGAIFVGLSYARRQQKFLTGALLGAVLGSSLLLLVEGAFGIAASNTDTKLGLRLVGIVMIGLGLLLLALIRQFMPQRKSEAQSPQLSENVNKTTKAPINIFISYRRDDSPDVTGRIYDVLAQYYGPASVFKDVDSIPFGVDFRKHLQSVIETCNAVLVVIGDKWLSISDISGQPRLTDQADFVRIEIESALQRDIPIVPVLVKGSAMPKEGDLPSSIKELAYRNGISVRYDPDFHHDMERLIHSLDEDFKPTQN